ncbi:ankyrin repeat-containing domain protein [Mucor mucedo]|uniref:ankyrin repeat-containing domain protein n=1 Tax=Mucor mucedo TaxID=29922 RepID=UPI00221FAA49|nr:ankyrin repeat-containing domain protein [Mucor mucedo]KAI7873282.1 ankyrin repeat-containing domain protein [Mucor mucedo]
MSTSHEELLDDLIYFARAGELEDLKETKVSPQLYLEKDESGKTALHMASANNHLEIVKYIVEQLNTLESAEKIALINTKNTEGNTPLHWAALNGNLEVVELLVKNNMNLTPIYEAQNRSHEKIAEFFLNTMIEEAPEEPLEEDEQFVETGVPSKEQ